MQLGPVGYFFEYCISYDICTLVVLWHDIFNNAVKRTDDSDTDMFVCFLVHRVRSIGTSVNVWTYGRN